jgi:A/G-specific adenine glycosylase
MLQQTQVPRVIPKYKEFLHAYPTMRDLAGAERSDVLRLWQGLGYNSRAARLHALARMLKGKELPSTCDELLKLPGIGPYTAGAIVIFAHNQPVPSVDVNVERVLRRVFSPLSSTPTKKELEELSLRLITESGEPRHWHAALMDLGSAICTAKNPRCSDCPLFAQCKSRGARPDEALHRQPAFVGSTRWWRGQILKRVLAGPVLVHHLLYRIKEQPSAEEEDTYAKALEGLVREGLVRRDGKLLLA